MNDRGRRLSLLVVALVVSLALALLALAAMVSAFGSGAHKISGSARASDVVVAVVAVILLISCTHLAIHLEHQMSGNDPVAATYRPKRQLNFGPAGFRTRGRYGPRSALFQSVFLIGIVIALVVFTVVGKIDGNRSASVQAHGFHASGTVTGVTSVPHSSRYSTWYSSNLDVKLTAPVDGARQTVVRDPSLTSLQVGDVISVLVDPHDPSYAELPGVPNTSSSSWIWTGLFALFIGFFAARSLSANYGLLLHRRASGVGSPGLSENTGR